MPVLKKQCFHEVLAILAFTLKKNNKKKGSLLLFFQVALGRSWLYLHCRSEAGGHIPAVPRQQGCEGVRGAASRVAEEGGETAAPCRDAACNGPGKVAARTGAGS